MLNHLISTNQINGIKLDQLIDFQSRKHKSIHQVIHIHAFLLEGMFDKQEFKKNKYDTIFLNKSQLTSNDVVDYCLRIALNAKRRKNSELFGFYQNVILKK